MEDGGTCFNDYCIVCDKAIIPPKEVETEKEEEVKVVVAKKKVAAGAIRVKNADGTVTTRTATGSKTTRPPLRRGPNSANRLAGDAAAPKRPQALTRSKTTESIPQTQATSSSDPLPLTPFHSPIYCSRECAKIEAARSVDFVRKMSIESSLYMTTSNIPITRKSPYNPTTPLSGSETSNSPNNRVAAPASAPNYFFHIHRDTDEAWRDVNRQRRASVHPSFKPATGMAMNRNRSQSSGTFSQPSSDSLNSLWLNGMGPDLHLGRSISGQGVKRMPPVEEHVPISGAWPIVGIDSKFEPAISSSYQSDTSIPEEFGSQRIHTYQLWNSYHKALSHRSPDTSNTCLPVIATTPTDPSLRQMSNNPSTIQRPVGGTIRAKSKSDVSKPDVTWDSFGLSEVNAKKKQEKPVETIMTPRQRISIGEKGCMITYPSSPTVERRTSAVGDHPGALAIPLTSTGYTSPGRTPTPTPHPRAPSTSDVPNLAGLRIGAGPSCSPYLSTSHGGQSGPKSTWNWSKWEREGGGKTYIVPEQGKAGAGSAKQGLFFFK